MKRFLISIFCVCLVQAQGASAEPYIEVGGKYIRQTVYEMADEFNHDTPKELQPSLKGVDLDELDYENPCAARMELLNTNHSGKDHISISGCIDQFVLEGAGANEFGREPITSCSALLVPAHGAQIELWFKRDHCAMISQARLLNTPVHVSAWFETANHLVIEDPDSGKRHVILTGDPSLVYDLRAEDINRIRY